MVKHPPRIFGGTLCPSISSLHGLVAPWNAASTFRLAINELRVRILRLA